MAKHKNCETFTKITKVSQQQVFAEKLKELCHLAIGSFGNVQLIETLVFSIY